MNENSTPPIDRFSSGADLGRRLLKGSAVYLVGMAATFGIPIIVAPIYTRYISPEEYGVVTLAQSFRAVGKILIPLSLFTSIPYYFMKFRKDPVALRTFLGTLNTLAVMIWFGMTLLCLGGGWLVCDYFLGDKGFPFLSLGLFTILAASGSIWIMPPNHLWRCEERQWPTVLLSVSTLVVVISVSLYLVVILRRGAWGAIFGNFVGFVGIGLFCAFLIFRRGGFAFSPPLALSILAYSLPLLPHVLCRWVLSLSDRLLIAKLTGDYRALGQYGFAALCAGVFFQVLGAVQTAWSPLFMDTARHAEKASEKLGRTSSLAFLGLGWVAAGGILFSRELVAAVAPPQYSPSALYAALLIFAMMFLAYYHIFVLGLFHTKRTRLIPVITLVGGAVSLTLNIVLLPVIGVLGACFASICGFAAMAAMSQILGMKHFPLVLNRRAILLGFLLPLASLFAVTLPGAHPWFALSGKLLAFCAVSIWLASAEREGVRKAWDLLTGKGGMGR